MSENARCVVPCHACQAMHVILAKKMLQWVDSPAGIGAQKKEHGSNKKKTALDYKKWMQP